VTLRRIRWDRVWSIVLLVIVVLAVAGCAGAGTGVSGGSPSPVPSAAPHPPLVPAQPGADPISFLAWVFTPIFQTMFIVLVAVHDFLGGLGVPAAIGWAIVALFEKMPSRRPATTVPRTSATSATTRGAGRPRRDRRLVR